MIKVIKKSTQKRLPHESEEISNKLGALRHKSEEERTANFANKLGISYLDLSVVPVDTETVRHIPENESRKYELGVIQKVGKKAVLAATDPSKEEVQAYIEKLKAEEGFEVKLFVVSRSSMEKIWNCYKNLTLLEKINEYDVNLEEKDLDKFRKQLDELVTLKKRITEIPTTEVIDVIMAGAVKLGASDIHLEPQTEQFRLRYRIDGVLQDVTMLPISVYRYVVNRIKMMSSLKINVNKSAQDGKFTIKLNEDEVDVRVSMIPTGYGETVVMRLLFHSSIEVNIEDSGLRGKAYEEVQRQLGNKTGMILTSGPTGSGKTTTLYSLINKANKPDLKVITIEDPVEYRLKGITQTQVSEKEGYSFASGLRSIVRQDPDVILVGEIRDSDTASIAIQAALTGHLVFSTIHANHSAAIVPRLVELGVKPDLIPPAINAFVAQRLVRRLCPHCKEEYAPAEETLEKIKRVISVISPKAKIDIPKSIKKLYRAKGCEKCNFIGYKGRIGIFEVMTINSEIEKLILNMAGETEILMAALESGMVTLAQDGILKSLEGVTSLEEVGRVTGENVFLEEVYSKIVTQSLSRGFVIPKDCFKKLDAKIGNIKELGLFLKSVPTTELNKFIFAAALLLNANDIHIEPEEKNVAVRFRIDGILQSIFSVPIEEYPSLLGKVKELSGLKTEVAGGVKDSRFSINLEESFRDIKDTKIDARVSIILGGYGETVVMRLLNQSATATDLKTLGIRKENLDKILEAIKKPNGVILNTGPTGSGKTTTLYSLLQKLNKPEVKIITVEDPIEYRLEGILQTQADKEKGYSFADSLRALLRQNPDIMMIGEIRDKETASVAFQAALTGHLVLSTLHSNDAVSSVQRLENMGLTLSDISVGANAFIAQRLVRKLCDCKKKVKPEKEQKEEIERVLKTISKASEVEIPKVSYIFEPGGCKKCNGIGYQGRTAISEVLLKGSSLETLISKGALPDEIEKKATEEGMITMVQDGMLKVVEGETTLAEIERVTEE